MVRLAWRLRSLEGDFEIVTMREARDRELPAPEDALGVADDAQRAYFVTIRDELGVLRREVLRGAHGITVDWSGSARGHIGAAMLAEAYLRQPAGRIDMVVVSANGLNNAHGGLGLPVEVIKRVVWSFRPDGDASQDAGRVFDAENLTNATTLLHLRIAHYGGLLGLRGARWYRIDDLVGAVSVRYRARPRGEDPDVVAGFPCVIVYDRVSYLLDSSRTGPARAVCRTGAEAMDVARQIANRIVFDWPWTTTIENFDFARRAWNDENDRGEEWREPAGENPRPLFEPDEEVDDEENGEEEAVGVPVMNFYGSSGMVDRRREVNGHFVQDHCRLNELEIGDFVRVSRAGDLFDEVVEAETRAAAGQLFGMLLTGFEAEVDDYDELFACVGFEIEHNPNARVVHVQPSMYVGEEVAVYDVRGQNLPMQHRQAKTVVRISTRRGVRMQKSVFFHPQGGEETRSHEDARILAERFRADGFDVQRNRGQIFQIVNNQGEVVADVPFGTRTHSWYGIPWALTRDERFAHINAHRAEHVPHRVVSLADSIQTQRLKDEAWERAIDLAQHEDAVPAVHRVLRAPEIKQDDYRVCGQVPQGLGTTKSTFPEELVIVDAMREAGIGNVEFCFWVFGFWLGDGFSGRTAFAVGDDEAAVLDVRLARIARDLGCDLVTYRNPHNNDAVSTKSFRPAENALRRFLRAIGTFENKNISVEVAAALLKSPACLRRFWLAGLIDADGSCSDFVESDVYCLNQSLRQVGAAATHHKILTVAAAVATSLGFDSRLGRHLAYDANPMRDEAGRYLRGAPRQDRFDAQGRGRFPMGVLLLGADGDDVELPVALRRKVPRPRIFEGGDHTAASGYWRWAPREGAGCQVTGIRLRESAGFFFSSGWYAKCLRTGAGADFPPFQ
jgi:hypothetical protein